jgi:OFA family oxalate/formate antiporter-like MFS transporter
MIFTGQWLLRLGPRRCAVVGGLLFGGGWLLAGWGGAHFGFTVLGIGLLAGIGVGFAYIVPIATCIRWFPDRKGLVTGIAVAGFGGGAALVSQAGAFLIGAYGMTPFQTFQTLGGLFLILVPLAGCCLRNPPGFQTAVVSATAWRDTIRRPGFAILYLAMGVGLAAGFTVNANLKELFAGSSVTAGIAAVSAFALANAAGRITWGWFFDRFRGGRTVEVNLLLQSAVFLMAPWTVVSDDGLLLFAVLAGFNYGGVLVLYASSVAHRWGSESVGGIYGMLFSANVPAAAAPLVAGWVFDRTGGFSIFLWFLSAGLAVAAVLFLRLFKAR